MSDRSGAGSSVGVGRVFRAYAALVRLPNLFTSPPDVILGAAIVVSLGRTVSIGSVIGLSVASVLLYAAGTTLNDYFDAAEDERERPERPIPSGTVSRTSALVFGAMLLSGGVVVALLAAGPTGGVVAAILAMLILLYDGVFKGTVVGFLFMGASRGTNVLLGTAVAVSPTALPTWALSVPVVITLYIASVTYMAEHETSEGDTEPVLVAMGGVVVAVAGVVGVLTLRAPPLVDVGVSAAILVGFVAWTGRALRRAYLDPLPRTVGPAVGACVLGLIALTASFAAVAGAGWSLAGVAFLVPAVGLSRLFDVS